jgi:hypothetical protein
MSSPDDAGNAAKKAARVQQYGRSRRTKRFVRIQTKQSMTGITYLFLEEERAVLFGSLTGRFVSGQNESRSFLK